MSLVTHGFDLPIMPGSISPVLHLSQYDDARTFTAHLKGEDGNPFTLPSGASAKLEGMNCKGVTFEQTATVSGSDITFTPKEAATDQPGLIAATLHIKNSNDNISTLAVILNVQKNGATKEEQARSPGFTDAIQAAVEAWASQQGFTSPVVTFTTITGGHRLTITDYEHPNGQSIDIMDGEDTGVEVDTTLARAGMAADAAAVGAQLNSFSGSGTTEIQPSGSLDLFIKQSDTTLRLGTPDDCRTAYFPCIPFTRYTVKKTVSSAAFSVGWTTVMPASGVLVNGFQKDLSATSFEITTGENAAYIVVYYAYNEASPETVYNSVRLVVPNSITLKQKIAAIEQSIDDLDDEVADSLGDYFTTVTETIQTDPSAGSSGGGGGTSTSINLLNPNDPDIEANKTVAFDGSIVTASGESISGYIPVSGGGVWYAYHYPQGESRPGFLLYNASKQYVDYWVPVEGSSRIHFATDGNGHKYLAFKLSDGSSVRYVRVSTDTSALGVYAMFVEAETMPNTYVPYGDSGGGGDDEPTDQTIVTVTRNALKGDVSNLGGKRIRLTMERGTFASGGKPSSAFSPLPSERCRTAYYIKNNGATSFSLLDLGQYVHGSIYVEYYNASMTFLSESSALTSPLNITIPNNAAYLKFGVVSSERIRTLDAVFYGGIYAPEQVKNKAIWGSSASEQILFDIKDDTYGCARLALPSVYSVDGAPVPLIVYAHGSGMMNNWNQEITRFSINKYFCDEGFAFLEVFGLDNEDWTTYGNGIQGVDPYPIPYWLRMYEHAVNHVCDLYNIDRDNIHVVCKSQGGQLTYYYASNPPAFPIRSISMFAPVLDYFSMDGLHTSADIRRVLAREMGFEGNVESDYVGKGSYTAACKAFFELNIEKFNGMNEAWTGLVGQTLAEKYSAAIDNGEKWWANKSRTDVYQDLDLAKIAFIPVKIWCAVNDDQTPYQKCVEAVAQLNNGGTEAHMRTFQTGGHAINTSTGEQTTNVTAANGVVWSTVPTCLVEAVQWMRQKMPHGG